MAGAALLVGCGQATVKRGTPTGATHTQRPEGSEKRIGYKEGIDFLEGGD